jgi:membrane protein DedA with SNARE-associated domain
MSSRPQFLALVLVVGAVVIFGAQFNLYHYATHTQDGTAILANVTSVQGALTWIRGAGYFLMFVAMVIEGPVITAAAAFGVALGYFNIFIVFGLSVAGELVGDFIYYGIGYFGRVRFVERYGHHIGLTERRLKHMERLIKKHPKKH